jgi:hypothetical protein
LGCAELVDSHRPDSFRMKRFVASTGYAKKAGKNGSAGILPARCPITDHIVQGFRAIRPPQMVRVELRGEQPAQVYLRGMRGKVVAASGPWRGSGDWWQEDAWHQDEWDLEIEFSASSIVAAQHAAPVPPQQKSERSQAKQQDGIRSQRGVYRIYFDTLRPGWFLRGVYD